MVRARNPASYWFLLMYSLYSYRISSIEGSILQSPKVAGMVSVNPRGMPGDAVRVVIKPS